VRCLLILLMIASCSTTESKATKWKSVCPPTDIIDMTLRPWSKLDIKMLKTGKKNCLTKGRGNRVCLREMHRQDGLRFFFQCGFKRSKF
jgi:hypothetical protein